MIDINDMRKRHANSIRNTATGRALGLALTELEELRERLEHLGTHARGTKVKYSEYDAMTNTQPYAQDLGIDND